VNTPPAPITIPPNSDDGVAVDLPEITTPSAALVAASELPSFVSIRRDLHEQYLSIHQLLL
jgi:hypothetical protein